MKCLLRLLQQRGVRLGLGRHVTDVLVITDTLVITDVLVITNTLAITDAPPDRAAAVAREPATGHHGWSRLVTAGHG